MQKDKTLSIDEFLNGYGQIVDLRTPSEYQKGHIPGAINVAVFSDDERKEVGKAFKLQGPFKAAELGLKLVGPKLSEIVVQLKENKKFPIKVYCSRGGMRSQSIGWLLNFCRIEAFSLRQGYKNYRRFTQDVFSKNYSLNLIQPSLGVSIDTKMEELKKEKEQVLDLEELAKYSFNFFQNRDAEQPSTEQFENKLAQTLNEFDLQKPIWTQNVGKELGGCKMPPSFLKHFRHSSLYLFKEDKKERLKAFAKTIQSESQSSLTLKISKLQKKLGSNKLKAVLEALDEKQFDLMSQILIDHFDKIAFFHLKKHKGSLMIFD